MLSSEVSSSLTGDRAPRSAETALCSVRSRSRADEQLQSHRDMRRARDVDLAPVMEQQARVLAPRNTRAWRSWCESSRNTRGSPRIRMRNPTSSRYHRGAWSTSGKSRTPAVPLAVMSANLGHESDAAYLRASARQPCRTRTRGRGITGRGGLRPPPPQSLHNETKKRSTSTFWNRLPEPIHPRPRVGGILQQYDNPLIHKTAAGSSSGLRSDDAI